MQIEVTYKTWALMILNTQLNIISVFLYQFSSYFCPRHSADDSINNIKHTF